MTGRRFRATLIAGGLFANGLAVAQMYSPGSAEGVPGEELYQACAFCHGAQGQGRQRLDAPALAGMEAWYVERQLHNLDSGVRGTHAEDLPGRQMVLITGMLRNEATIKNVAAYIETLTPGGRQPISENLSPLGPKNHSMWVADVPMSRAWMTLRPIALTSS